MCKQAEKCLVLLILSLVFYPTSLEDTIKQQVSEYTIKLSKNQSKQQQQIQQPETLAEKQKKLENFDTTTFFEVYNYGFVKPFLIIKDSNDFINMKFNNTYDQSPLWKPRERLEQEYQEIKYLNDIASILKIYSNVNIIKVARLLDLGKDQLEKYLDSYKKRNEFNIREEVPFEDTILRRFLGAGQVQLDFKVQGDQIIVTEVAPERNYAEYFTKLNAKLAQIDEELSKVGNV
ncbi:hypothetical protein PPERSA_00499 [Pseudocohnilembus persalinus]|uniref:Uncharacterized protein n=1 Tax=Pseudocohnilembus persalinus TaxID=266149 RepID=A0A0V0R8C0_PSEPJ|nr:hypothetical protein PPERSA_00499 [Pseudocohnilembus persalinus]|eukprot:KRX10729.1 hypothetical protein PPERSA_00499 [Pseudocohnilembus persalinus]